MKKFTELSGNEEIRQVVYITEDSAEKTIKSIIESSLNISVDGEIDDYLFRNIGIDGKDKLIEKLTSYINEVSYKNTSFILEKIKYQGLNKVLLEHQLPNDIKRYSNVIEDMLTISDPIEGAIKQSSNMSDGEEVYYIGATAEKMINSYPDKGDTLRKIHDVFSMRAKQLGFNTHG